MEKPDIKAGNDFFEIHNLPPESLGFAALYPTYDSL
jgi:hypothetical protein